MLFPFPRKDRAIRRISAVSLSVVLGMVLVLTGSTTSAQTVAYPSVTGPIASTGAPGNPAHDYVFYATPMDLKKVGYVEQEYFISGIATRLALPAGQGVPTSIGTM